MTVLFDDGKADGAMRTIGEVCQALNIKPHILRYWEQQFPMLRPLKRRGGRRYYRGVDVALVERINTLVNEQGFTLKGAEKALRDEIARDEVERYETMGHDAEGDDALILPIHAAIDDASETSIASDGGVSSFFGQEAAADAARQSDAEDRRAQIIERLRIVHEGLARAIAD